MEAVLALADGRVFRGRAFGAAAERTGEVVFNTAMTGYQEILTDPSYRGQIVTMTATEIGNVGTNPVDTESSAPQVEGFVVRELSESPSNWRSAQDLHAHLRGHGIPGIADIDTRALTRHLRTRGVVNGAISTVRSDVEALIAAARKAPDLGRLDLVARVTSDRVRSWSEAREPGWRTPGVAVTDLPRPRCVAYDFGAKRNIFRLLHESGFDVTVVPASLSAEDTLALRPDAVFLSNGPGDPQTPSYAIEAVSRLAGRIPIFGICLGHQIAALAIGGRTVKLKFGHRGANHPVRDLRTGRVEITSQNHGYAVAAESLPKTAAVTHVNLNDQTCEGFFDAERRLLAIQYHPESSPGPHDALGLFREFRAMAGGLRSSAVDSKGAR